MTLKEVKKILTEDNKILIGYTTKTHATGGQLTINLFLDFEPDFVLIEKDGFLIPFIIEKELSDFFAVKPFFKLKNIDTIDEAVAFTNKKIFYPVSYLLDTEFEILNFEFFIDFDLYENEKKRGKIIGFIDQKYNRIFEILTPTGKEEMIPLNAFQIIAIDLKQKKIKIKVL